MSYELKIDRKDRAAGRFIGAVRKALLRAAFAEKESSGITQQSIATKLGVNRSVIHRMLKGEANLTLRSVAEIAWALGWDISFTLQKASKSVSTQTTASGRKQENVSTLSADELLALVNGSRIVTIESESRTTNDNHAPVEVAA